MFAGSNAELIERLTDEKREVEKLGFALDMLVDNPEVERMVCRINGWIDDACDRLRYTDKPDPL